MIALRKSQDRGHFDHGWLDTYHTFSFAGYYDPKHSGFRSLRVINEDRVQPGQGFGTHPHRDMEILTYILQGALEHRDSLGTGSVIRPGEVQRMSAGTGVLHSEYNPSPSDAVHLLQIWILPRERGIRPSYEQRAFPMETAKGKLLRLASGNGQNGAANPSPSRGTIPNVRDGLAGDPPPLGIHQDVELYVTRLDAAQSVVYQLAPSRHAWLQVARGQGSVNGIAVEAGDGAAISNESRLEISGGPGGVEALLFDLA